MANVSFEWNLKNRRYEGETPRVEPGSTIEGWVTVTSNREVNCNGVKIRLEWHTEGRGDRDGRVVAEQEVFRGVLSADQPSVYSFQLRVPEEPWSYSGYYINILWDLIAEVDLPMAFNPKSALRILVRPPEA
jgi:hypothetical protein